MSKKLMSCVVAFAFIMSIATNVFAAPTASETGSEDMPDGSYISLKKKAVTDPEEGENIVSKISEVYNYKAGSLISIGDPNGGFQLIRDGAVFMSVAYNFDTGLYSVTGINLNGAADMAQIEKMDGATYEEKLVNYLKTFGITESMLNVKEEVVDEDGNPVVVDADAKQFNPVKGATSGKTYSTLDEYNARDSVLVAWVSEAVNTLQSGVNYGIAVNFGDGGATMTTLMNGKAQVTYAAGTYSGALDTEKSDKSYAEQGFATAKGPKAVVTAVYHYDDGGFLDNIQNFTIEGLFSSDANRFQDAVKRYMENNPDDTDGSGFTWDVAKDPKYGFTSEDDFNKCAEAYSDESDLQEKGKLEVGVKSTKTYFNAMGQASYLSDSYGNVAATYTYSSNGSALSVIDNKTGGKTYYSNGKPSSVVNESGALTATYQYHPNGAIDSVTTYNKGVATGMTVYIKGKEATTSNFTGGAVTADELRKGYLEFTAPGTSDADMLAIARKYQFTNFKIYSGHLNNQTLMNFILNPSGSTDLTDMNKALQNMRNDTNFYSAVGSANLLEGRMTESISNGYTVDGKTFATEEELKEYMASTMSASQRASQLKDSEGNSITDENGNYLEGKSAKDIDLDKSTNKDNSSHTVTHSATEITYATLDIKVTVYAQGQLAYSFEAGQRKCEELSRKDVTNTFGGYSDPAVVGVVDSFVDADGNVIGNVEQYLLENPGAKVYAKVSASGINMMDGSGFAAADGEEIFVEITADMAKELSIGKEAMFMGDVSKSSDGQYIMRTNDNYNVTVNGTNYKGFVTGADLAAAKTEVQNESIKALDGDSKYGWMNVNTNVNRGLFGLSAGSYLNDWKAGWAILSGWNN